MPSIRGSSTFKPIKGITVYGATGPTGPTGPTGSDLYGPTGATAELYLSNITLSGYTLITTFTNGTTFAATGLLFGITGNTEVYLEGKTGSTGSGYIFVGNTGDTEVQIRRLKGSTAYRSFVGITSDSETLTITVDRYDGEYTLSVGSLSEIIATNPAGNLIGVTLGAAKYGNITNVIQVNKQNVYEKTRGMAYSGGSVDYSPILLNSVIVGQKINIHPNTIADNTVDKNAKAKVYAVSLQGAGDRIEFYIDTPTINSTGFSLYVSNGNMSSDYTFPTFKTTSGLPIKFPFKSQPCFRSGEKYLIHFVSSNKTWYGYIFGNNGGNGNYFCKINSEDKSENSLKLLSFYDGLTGACCKNDGTCEISFFDSCSGYFSGVGTTCGTIGVNSVCSENKGACCVKNIVDGKTNTYCIDNVSALDCQSLNTDSVESIFTGHNTTCANNDCFAAFEEKGACCDGKGGCTQQTKENCIISGGSFLGKGIQCSADEVQLCSSDVGACCYSNGTCSGVTASYCFENNGYFHGKGTTCGGVTCGIQTSCGSFLGLSLRPGDLFGGGIIAGIYNPKTSKVLGAANAFSRKGITSSFMTGGETFAAYYQSEYDYVGYGVTGETCVTLLNEENLDSYYVIVSLYPASIDEKGNAIDPTQEQAYQETFAWYGTGLAWGPILHPTTYTLADFSYLNETYETSYLQFGEGFYGVTGETLDNIKNYTFQTCGSSRKNGLDPVARLFTRNIKTSNGLWNRNWGLYNTIRLISADNADHLNLSSTYYKVGDFASTIQYNSVYALKMFDNGSYTNSYGLTANPSALSDWFIPSQDELAFMAANCTTDGTNPYYGFNLNTELLRNNGVPVYGWHWSSTGSFDITNSTEGIYISGKPKQGTVAWSIYFDQDGDSTKFLVKKEARSKQLKVRPIRLMRCDGKVPSSAAEEYKLWKTPNLLRIEQ